MTDEQGYRYWNIRRWIVRADAKVMASGNVWSRERWGKLKAIVPELENPRGPGYQRLLISETDDYDPEIDDTDDE